MRPAMNRVAFNRHGVWAIYKFELARAGVRCCRVQWRP